MELVVKDTSVAFFFCPPILTLVNQFIIDGIHALGISNGFFLFHPGAWPPRVGKKLKKTHHKANPTSSLVGVAECAPD
jgi:hypothetical protein